MHVFVRDILEQTHQIDFLLVISTQRGARLLPNNCHHAGVIHFGVIESVEQMNCTGT